MFEQLTSKNGKQLITKNTRLPVYKEPVEKRIIILCKILYGDRYRRYLPSIILN